MGKELYMMEIIIKMTTEEKQEKHRNEGKMCIIFQRKKDG